MLKIEIEEHERPTYDNLDVVTCYNIYVDGKYRGAWDKPKSYQLVLSEKEKIAPKTITYREPLPKGTYK